MKGSESMTDCPLESDGTLLWIFRYVSEDSTLL